MRGLTLGEGGPLRVLCLGAHSDDVEIGCGATILALSASRPVEVTWVVLSATAQRAREARRSAALFLAQAVKATVLVRRFRDGFFPFVGAQIKEFMETLAPIAPDVVFTHYRHDRHQDHRLVSDLTWNTFRNHLVLEYEIPKYDGDLGTADFYVPVERRHAVAKVEHLLRVFATQRDRHWFADETFLGLMRLRGMECRAPEDYAEAFYARKVALDLTPGSGPDGRLAGARRAKR